MHRILSFCLVILCSGLFLSMDCQESLPPYSPPDSIYSLVFRADQEDLDFVQRSINEIYMGRGGFGFNMDLVNLFDETLYGASLDTLGEVFIWWENDPTVMATLHLTSYHEIVTYELNDPSHVFFDPGDSIRLAIVWRYWKDDLGNDIWIHTGSTYENQRTRYDPMHFIAQARIQLFAETPDVYSNQIFFTVHFYQDHDE